MGCKGHRGRTGLGVEVDGGQGGIMQGLVKQNEWEGLPESSGSVPADDLLRRGRQVGIEGPPSHSTAASRDPPGLV